jgi:signal peptidase I
VLLQLIKIEGHSLEPVYQAGDFVLVSGIPLFFSGIHPGDVVVFDHPSDGKVIKLVEHLEGDGSTVFVVGLHPDSIDSRTYGAIPRSTILGKVVWHIHKK